jgi:holo-[acyl-carrier protein] synthase
MIVGTGIDVVDIPRFAETLERTPGLRTRLFTEAERDLPMRSLAARFAAKEALAKALGAPGNLHWHDAEVVSEASGRPLLQLRGTVQDLRSAPGRKRVTMERRLGRVHGPGDVMRRPFGHRRDARAVVGGGHLDHCI